MDRAVMLKGQSMDSMWMLPALMLYRVWLLNRMVEILRAAALRRKHEKL